MPFEYFGKDVKYRKSWDLQRKTGICDSYVSRIFALNIKSCIQNVFFALKVKRK